MIFSLSSPLFISHQKPYKKKQNFYCIRLDAVLSAPSENRIGTTTTNCEADETRSTLTFLHEQFFLFFLSFKCFFFFYYLPRDRCWTRTETEIVSILGKQYMKQSKRHNRKWTDSKFLFRFPSSLCVVPQSSIKMHAPCVCVINCVLCCFVENWIFS